VQGVVVPAPAAQEEPAGHGTGATAPKAQKKPAGVHAAHADKAEAPTCALKVPAGHCVAAAADAGQ